MTTNNDAILTVAALAAEGDDVAAAVLLDTILDNPRQSEWRDERVMMLCLGVPLDPRPPARLGELARHTWRRQRKQSIAFALTQWDLYAGRSDFQRAVVAVVVFGEWAKRTSAVSPWPVCRAADTQYQERLATRREQRRDRDEWRGTHQAEAERARLDAYWADPARPR